MAKVETKKASTPRWLPVTLAVVVLIVLLLSTYRLAESVAKFGLSDPDTCWLLAVGRYIVDHSSLPPTDPFSYTRLPASGGGAPTFVVYQWLSEVFFYLSFKCGGATGPLVLVALVLVNTFVVVPLVFAQKLKCPHLLSLVLVSLSTWAIFPRFFVRPEIWSNLFLMAWLVLLAVLRLRHLRRTQKPVSNDKKIAHTSVFANIDWPLVSVAVTMMLLWTNFHCCFVLGFLLLIAYLACTTAESILIGKPKENFPITEWIILPLAGIASLINPWGIGLWTYLPGIFFAPVNSMIKELQGFSPRDIQHPYYYPFIALVIAACCMMIGRINWAIRNKRLRETIGLFAPGLMLASIIEAICCKRAVAFTVAIVAVQLLVCWRQLEQATEKQAAAPTAPGGKKSNKQKRAEAREILAQKAKPQQAQSKPSFLASLEAQLEKFYSARFKLWIGAINILTAAVVVAYCNMHPQTIPEQRQDFRPPLQAVQWISKNTPPGRMFNSTLFGDVLIWYAPGNPSVFIDTRFDLYSPQLTKDYADIFFCHSGWHELLTKYSIDWVFVPTNSILAGQLVYDQAWKTLYSDSDAVILARKSKSSTPN
jgi:hypothetical protein